MFKFVALFCILNCVAIKGSYRTHGGNFITSQPVIKISRSVLWTCSVFSWLRTRSITMRVKNFIALHGMHTRS